MAESNGQYVLKSFDFERDFNEYCNWWVNDNQKPPSLDALPKTGFSLFKDTTLVACGFLAKTDTNTTIYCYWYTNQKSKHKHEVLSILSAFIIDYFKQTQFNRMFCFSANRGMIKLLERIGMYNAGAGHMVLEK